MGATGQTGTFHGHAIPASFFFGFGLFFLLLSLRRARALPPGTSFVEVHIPEKNMTLVRRLSYVLMVCTVVGFVYEGIGGYLSNSNFFNQSAHQTLYTSYFFVGCVMQAESWDRLPPESSRLALSLALLLEYVLWHEHAIMKSDGTDQRMHIIMAQVCLMGSALIAFSVCRPRNILAYVGGWGMLVLQSFWLITAGVNADYQKIPRHLIGVLLCLEVLAVASAILVGVACFGPVLMELKDNADRISSRGTMSGRPGRAERRAYATLDVNGYDEDDEAVPAVT